MGAKGVVFGLWQVIRKFAFEHSEARHEQLLKHGVISSRAIEYWNSAVFDLFRQMPNEIGAYSTQPPFLFYREEVDCFHSVHDDQLVATLADNIALLDHRLRDHFGCTLVFVPIPNKITVYSRYAFDDRYDDFLPHLCFDLKNRGVHTVELVPLFKQQEDTVYWATDTHWNDLGIGMAVEQTVRRCLDK
jgi:hypothetical protein